MTTTTYTTTQTTTPSEAAPLPDAICARNSLYLSGAFGTGKTSAALARIRWLLGQERTRGDDILVLVPQRSLGRPYTEQLRGPEIPPGPPVRVTTYAGLARAAAELYWPLVAPQAGFSDPRKEPTFLNLETSQYHMQRFVAAAFERGEFDAIRLEPGRVVSQVLDNLNKASLHGFSIEEAYERLALSVPAGEQMAARLNVLHTAARISREYRGHCLAESLVDFSLWIGLFNEQVLHNEWSRTHLFRSHRHLVMDNAEEDTFAAHRLVRGWLPHLESSLILSDDDGGYRVFLGAAPENAATLADACDIRLRLTEQHVTQPALVRMATLVDRAIRGPRPSQNSDSPTENPTNSPASNPTNSPAKSPQTADVRLPLHYQIHRFYPQMIDWAVDEIERLVTSEGVAPGGIAVLAPFVSDALRFSLQSRLEERGIPSTTHRPSRALNAEPAARALLTLAALAHPTWQVYPQPTDITLTFSIAIAGLDPVRAHLLSQVAYGTRGNRAGELAAFAGLRGPVQSRITYALGEGYERLRDWLYAYRAETDFTPLDQFFARLFGELLSQPGFGFHEDVDGARVANQLVVSARNFRWAVEETESNPVARIAIGKAYVELVNSGALGALFVPGWEEQEDVVFIAPAYTYLMRNRPVDVQFWLDVGATGWWERLYQPLTHPYVLSQQWPANAVWSDLDEFQRRQEMLRRLLIGLIRRTRGEIYLGLSDYGENGMEQRGPLLGLLNRILATGE
ncbi:MAG: hypothetical protein KF753_24770 [Caldilineaceae bacterium]|nr:hypothetical protein [Caldilineaceae bacterium]